MKSDCKVHARTPFYICSSSRWLFICCRSHTSLMHRHRHIDASRHSLTRVQLDINSIPFRRYKFFTLCIRFQFELYGTLGNSSTTTPLANENRKRWTEEHLHLDVACFGWWRHFWCVMRPQQNNVRFINSSIHIPNCFRHGREANT